MSRAQDRSTGVPTGAQPNQPNQPVTGTSGSATGASSASLRDQPATQTGAATTGTTGTPGTTGTTTGTTTSYARGTGTSASYGQSRSGASAGAGGIGLGGVISMVAGLLAFFTGLAAVVRQSFFTSLPGYAYRWNVHGWGWVLLVLGVLLFAAGAVHLLGMGFGKLAAVGLAVLTAVAGFLFLPYSPIWGTIVVALSALAIWACLRDDSSARAANSGAESGYGESSMGGTGSMSSGTTTTRGTRV
jgi:hypothetical protein